MGKYEPVTASAYMETVNGLKQFATSINEAGVDCSNIVLEAAARHSRQITPVHKKQYPPSRQRTPGTMRRSIKTIRATVLHPGKNYMQSWLWAWIEGWNRRNAAAGGKLKRKRNVTRRTRGVARFSKMVKTDPRRLLGEPVERQIKYIDRTLTKKLDAAIDKSSR